MTEKRVILTELRRNLPAYMHDVETLRKCSPTLNALLGESTGATQTQITPALIDTINAEISACRGTNKSNYIASILQGLLTDPHFVTPNETDIAAGYTNFEDIPTYDTTLLKTSTGNIYVDPVTNEAVLAPTSNSRKIAPAKNEAGYIGELTPNEVEVCLVLLEDEIQTERETTDVVHAIDTVTDKGGMGVFNLSAHDLIAIGVVSQAARDVWEKIEHPGDYALECLQKGIISQDTYDKLPVTVRSALQWYVLSHAEYWLEKTIGPSNFLKLKEVQRLLAYRVLLKQWKSSYQYFLNNFIQSKSQIAGFLIAERIFGKSLSQLFGLGAKFSTIIGKSATDIYNRIYKAVESGVTAPTPTEIIAGATPLTASDIDDAGKKIPAATPPAITTLPPSINEQPSNSALRKVPENTGFFDPKQVYPRVSAIGEPDTNRLARNEKTHDTVVGKKDAAQTKNIEIAGGGQPWSQPKSSYNAQYPYNHVQETESGHVIEYDDTPKNERMHWYHRAGTFTEIDRNGTVTRKIVGDSFEILERDGYIYIGGRANITIEGNCNILVKNNVNLEVNGKLIADVHNDMDLNIAGHFNVTSAGDINLLSGGKITTHSKKDTNISSRATLNVKSTTGLNMTGTTKTTISSPITEVAVLKTTGLSFVAIPPVAPTVDTPNVNAPKKFTPVEPVLPPLLLDDKLGEWSSALSTLAENAEANKEEIKVLKKKGIDEGLLTKEDLDKPLTAGQEDTTNEQKLKPAKVASCSTIYGVSSFSPSYQLSKNIKLGMLKGTDKLQAQHGLKIQDIVCNLRQLCENVIEPVYDIVGKSNIIISSTFRTPGQITGAFKPASGVSFHEQGLAVDFCFVKPFTEYYDVAVQLKQHIQFDKILLEYRLGNHKNVTTYKPWIHIQWQQQGLNLANGNSGSAARLATYTFKNDVTYATKFVNLLPDSALTY